MISWLSWGQQVREAGEVAEEMVEEVDMVLEMEMMVGEEMMVGDEMVVYLVTASDDGYNRLLRRYTLLQHL
jgi:hypothetical protein